MRIKLAALHEFGERGYDRATVRAIAERADVSPGLVLHHFGSKQRLREACDQWVIDWVASEKALTITGGSLPELRKWLDERPELAPLFAYLETCLRQGGDVADNLFDRLVAVSEETLRAGIEAGTINPIDDIPGTAAVLTAYSCGATLMSAQLGRLLGGDIFSGPASERYSRIGLRLYVQPLLAPEAWPLDDEPDTTDTPNTPTDKDES